ncbi:MAG: septum formation initiator family protein [Clostridiales bacterium]|nr:septum formation initiator family protein [Candidatus Crickella equi]
MKKSREKKKFRINLSSKRQRIIAAVLAVLLLLLVVYGRPIIKLRMENKQLQEQNEELTKEKNAKAKELKNVHSKDYIKEQARKQLRLLDKDEKIFIFEEDQDEAED